MRMMADAIRRAGSTDGAKIRDALAQTKDFSGVSGHISMDKDRNAQKDIVVLQIRDGQFRFVESIAPDAG
jgi:branched-chain amino acid transport system substrate-binding protein